jgi:hypothetical protein
VILCDNIVKYVKQQFNVEMEYYSLTNVIWTSKPMQSFMALTLHFFQGILK